MKFLAISLFVAMSTLVGNTAQSSAQGNDCQTDTLRTNSDGSFLALVSGSVFETLAGDNLTAKFWLPLSEVLVCGPTPFSFKGRNYQLYDVTNLDDGETVTALLQAGNFVAKNSAGGCHKSNITKPTPFLGNNGEVFTLSDGSIWEVKYEYEYLYEYYPTIIACPSQGYIIVGDKKLSAELLR